MCIRDRIYKAARGDGWWFKWTKKSAGTWKLRWGGSDTVWKLHKIHGVLGQFQRNTIKAVVRKHKQKKTFSGLPDLPCPASLEASS